MFERKKARITRASGDTRRKGSGGAGHEQRIDDVHEAQSGEKAAQNESQSIFGQQIRHKRVEVRGHGGGVARFHGEKALPALKSDQEDEGTDHEGNTGSNKGSHGGHQPFRLLNGSYAT